jgi:hypothetical protein
LDTRISSLMDLHYCFIANARSQLEAELETRVGIMATIKA